MALASAALALMAALRLAAPADGAAALHASDEAAAEERRRLVAVFPELAAELPVERYRSPLPSLLAWSRPGATIEVVDRQCRPLRLTRSDDVLLGKINVEPQVQGDTKSIHFEEVVFGERMMVTCGVTETFEREKGRWVKAGVGATGCASQFGLALSRVTEDAVWYQGVEVALSPRCVLRREESASCQGQDSGTRTCSRCERWALDERILTGAAGTVRGATMVVHQVASVAADCSQPCPPDPDPEHVRAVQLLQRRSFRRSLEGHPVLFRTEAACKRYWAKHPANAEERASPW